MSRDPEQLIDNQADWTRRRFLAASGAVAGSLAVCCSPHIEAEQARPDNTIPPPIVITGGIRPLLTSNIAQPLRYTPDGGDFLIRNGSEFFNRPLYGPISDFRIDAGDRPEFSLYLPGHGGNLKLGILASGGAKWIADADEVIARYRPGRMLYDIRDRLLGPGICHVELITAAHGNGILLKVEGENLPPGLTLTWAFGGASGRKGRRNGDIGCEVEPVARFFQLRPEECHDNIYTLGPDSATLKSPAGPFVLNFPPGAQLAVADFAAWTSKPARPSAPSETSAQSILTGSVPLSSAPRFLQITSGPVKPAPVPDPAAAFRQRSDQLTAIAATLSIETPDPFISNIAPALGIVADALWDERQQCVMHGCVAWRVALAGWRGPYVLDAIGSHDRAKAHFRHWLAKQNVAAITTADPATGPADPNMQLARKEGLLHSNGDLSGNHYDMNLVCIDALLRHLRWTGDLDFAREIWPALERHLAWEHRLFRRVYTTADGRQVPLYEAYAAIWASDNLQYTGGGTAHASAYNLFALRRAIAIGGLIGKDTTIYAAEAALLQQGMHELLWLPRQGAFAEAKDLMGPQTVYTNPALWTVYHTIDSDAATPRQAWQMAAERNAVIKHVPVQGPGVPPGDWYLLSCSDWLPYMWSLNLLLLGENMHMALAMWQAGMAEDAFRIFKGAILDSMYCGLCPGDFHMTSALDAHRQEAQRDFGDPTGCTARALVEGLFGVTPDLVTGHIRIRPGFPADWGNASLHHKDFDLAWKRNGLEESFDFTSRFPKPASIILILPARTTTLPTVTSAGRAVPCTFDPEAVGTPCLLIQIPAATTVSLNLRWSGEPPLSSPPQADYTPGQPLRLPPGVKPQQLDDPQQALASGRTATLGFHTVFARMQSGACTWTLPISFKVRPNQPEFLPIPTLRGKADPIDLTPILTHQITDIFTRRYTEPRPAFCSAEIPDTLLGGWANIGKPEPVSDAGLRAANGTLTTAIAVPFRTPTGSAPNCRFLSYFQPDQTTLTVPLTGRANGLYLLLTGTTLPQCSRMEHALVTVRYADHPAATLSLRNPETWWPIEQDYLLDDFLFVNDAPLPPRLNLTTGQTRILDPVTFRGKGRSVPGGAATILHLPLDPSHDLRDLTLDVKLYGIVAALLGATLTRS